MATVNPDDPRIAVACTDVALPTGIAAGDCYVPELNYGPGTNLYYAKKPFDADPTALSFAAALAPPTSGTAGPDMVGPIIGEYSTNAGQTASDRVNGVDIPKPGALEVAVKISDTRSELYEMARTSQKGGLSGYFYIVDRNGYIYGGRNGVFGGKARLFLHNILPGGEFDLHTITGKISGYGFFDMRRSASPVPVV